MFARYEKKIFQFKVPGGTSRGVLTQKMAWFIYLQETEDASVTGTGECSIIPGLSPDFTGAQHYEEKVREVCTNIDHYLRNPEKLRTFPSILFGLETALLDLRNGGKRLIFDNAFSRGEQQIPINGLVWMGDESYLQKQIAEKLEAGFTCIKMKVGAIDFDREFSILRELRQTYPAGEITIRVDANGAFNPKNCLGRLEQLASLDIHSIEQPIAPKQDEWMKKIIERSPLPIALDEELIGIHDRFDKEALLDFLKPPFIILKPSLHGGIKGCNEWIRYARARDIDWWMTSALESNIGLNAVAQFAAEYPLSLPQGLGTGSLYTNNIESDLVVKNGHLFRNIA